MGKKIILCADGTWNTPKDKTNVYKLSKAITISATQVAFYEDGVGVSGNPLDHIAGGAFGDGLFKIIKNGYTKIAHVYEKGDEIFLFGFSRGAYIARSLAGMIAICGLPTASFGDQLVETAFRAYRDPANRAMLLASLSTYNLDDAKIKMVGVWETVGSLGIPAIFGGIDPALYGFLDTNLHPDVLNAYQALAIDEKRREFPPTLWTLPQPFHPGQTVEQVWFAGVHSDVGGGYAETGLSDITFGWILGKAMDLGMVVDPGIATQYRMPVDPKWALDQIHESWSPLPWLFPKKRDIADDARLSNSVDIRCRHSGTYAPTNLKLQNSAPVDSYQLVPVADAVPA